jgi:hypothetical protein
MKYNIIKLLELNRIGIISLLILFSACSDKNEEIIEPPLPEGDIVPLSVGNQWVFNSYNSETNVLDATITMDIIDKLSDNRYQYGWTVEYINGDFRYSQGTCQLKEDGYYQASLLYKYPAKKGEEYSNGLSNIKVSSLYEVITVPAGTFKCIRYETYWSDFEGGWKFDCYTWVSPGVGQIAESKEISGNYFRQLATYTIK